MRSLASVSPTDRVTDLETSGEYPNNATSVPESQPQPQRLAPSLSEPHEGLISAEMETAKDEVDGMVNFDSFDAVCGYVKIVVTFGAALSEVSLLKSGSSLGAHYGHLGPSVCQNGLEDIDNCSRGMSASSTFVHLLVSFARCLIRSLHRRLQPSWSVIKKRKRSGRPLPTCSTS